MKVNMRLDQVLINQLGMQYFISIHFVSNHITILVYLFTKFNMNLRTFLPDNMNLIFIPAHFWLRLIGNISDILFSDKGTSSKVLFSLKVFISYCMAT